MKEDKWFYDDEDKIVWHKDWEYVDDKTGLVDGLTNSIQCEYWGDAQAICLIFNKYKVDPNDYDN